MRRKPRPRPRRPRTPAHCPVCQENLDLDYKNPEVLARFISDWGKIVGRVKSGVCAKHQRKLASEIKRARHLALLPFVARLR